MEDIVVIGGGLAGTALADALARRGSRVLLLESTTIGGAGATAHSRGMVRLYDPVPEIVRLSRDGIAAWAEIEMEEPGLFHRPGLLYFFSPENIAAGRAFAERESRADYPVEFVDGASAAAFFPGLNEALARPERMAIWEPGGGYVEPRAAAQFLARRALAHGAETIEGCKVAGIVRQAGHVTLQTSAGTIQARRVVMATGAAALDHVAEGRAFCRSIPLTSFHQPGLGAPASCLIDEVSKCYVRPQSARYYFAGGCAQVDAERLDDLVFDQAAGNAENHALTRRVLATRDNHPVAGHEGFDAYTPDFLPITVTPSNGGGLGFFTGFSGRGAKYMPAIAESFAEAIIGTA
ncbi:MAG: FAD-dependent oxidoreductase [Hyphomicrobiales bacterium]